MGCGCRSTGYLRGAGAELRADPKDSEITRLAMRLAGSSASPDGSGLVRWLGVLWRGVPMPLRIWLAYRHGFAPDVWPGCGCLDALKSLSERLSDAPVYKQPANKRPAIG